MKTLQLFLVIICSAAAADAFSANSPAKQPDTSVNGLPVGEPGVIVEWNAALCAWFEEFPDHVSLQAQARLFAMMHLAMREAVAAVGTPVGHAAKQAQASLAALAAGRAVIEAAVPLDMKMFSALHNRYRAIVGDEADAARATKIGQEAGATILQRRRTDGWPVLVADEQAGVRTAAELLRAPVESYAHPGKASAWTKLAPFGLKKVQQFEPEPPYFSYGDGLVLPNDRLEKRNRIGAPGHLSAALPVFHAWRTRSIVRWNRVAQSLALRHPATLVDQARVFATLNNALADALLAGSYWNERYQTGRANPPYVTISQNEVFDRALEKGHMPAPPEVLGRTGRPIAGFPAITAVLAGAAEAVLGANYGGGEAVVVADQMEGPTTLHSAARDCAWAMASNGTSGSDGCISGHDFGIRIGDYIRKQPAR